VNDLELAHHLAAIADDIALRYFERGVALDYKADGSYVTTADLAVDAAIRDELGRHRPDDAILTEEYGTAGAVGASRRWLIDPIDGTSWFVDRTPHWGVHVALEVDGTIELALISRPLHDRWWFASRGGGAHRREGSTTTPVRVSTTSDLGSARISGYVSYWSDTVDRVHEVARWVQEPSPTLALLDGRIDAVIGEGGYPWDLAPSVVLVSEAGGRFTDPYGGTRLDLRASVSSNGVLHDAVCALAWG